MESQINDDKILFLTDFIVVYFMKRAVAGSKKIYFEILKVFCKLLFERTFSFHKIHKAFHCLGSCCLVDAFITLDTDPPHVVMSNQTRPCPFFLSRLLISRRPGVSWTLALG